jgi:transposase-like protein
MSDALEVRSGRRVRRWRSVSEKHAIVQLTLKPGASVAEVARAHGVNANQVFKWRRPFERGKLSEPSVALIPVTVASVSFEPVADPSIGMTSTEEASFVVGSISVFV